MQRFLEEYEEDRLARLREKDSKAFHRRLARYNKKSLCSIQLPGGEPFEFFEPQREVTLFGLISQLEIVDPDLLRLEILDYDDYRGIDLLVRKKAADPGDLLARDKVAYTEIKHVLESNINHAFANLHAIVCWESDVSDLGKVTDPTGVSFDLRESQDPQGVTHTALVPLPHNTELSHQVRVIVLKRLMQETRGYQERANPRAVKNGSR